MFINDNVFKATIVDDKSIVAYNAIDSSSRGKAFSATKGAYRDLFKPFIHDSAMHDANFAFLSTQLAKLYNQPLEPKLNFTYMEDVPIDVGGGFVDYVTSYQIDYAGIANQARNNAGNSANYIPRVNAGMVQVNYTVYTFELAYDIRFIELEKMKKLTLQKSLESIYQNVIMSCWNSYVEQVAYFGAEGSHGGLFNSDKVPVNVAGLKKSEILAETVTDAQLAGIFNGILMQACTTSNNNFRAIPDTFLIPAWLYTVLNGRFSNLYNNSLLDFLRGHNVITAQTGKPITITLRKGLDTLGSANVGRIVAYKKDKEFVRIDMPYPMKHYVTLPNMERMGYTSAFVGQVSEIQFPYTNGTADTASPVQYYDFTA